MSLAEWFSFAYRKLYNFLLQFQLFANCNIKQNCQTCFDSTQTFLEIVLGSKQRPPPSPLLLWIIVGSERVKPISLRSTCRLRWGFRWHETALGDLCVAGALRHTDRLSPTSAPWPLPSPQPPPPSPHQAEQKLNYISISYLSGINGTDVEIYMPIIREKITLEKEEGRIFRFLALVLISLKRTGAHNAGVQSTDKGVL